MHQNLTTFCHPNETAATPVERLETTTLLIFSVRAKIQGNLCRSLLNLPQSFAQACRYIGQLFCVSHPDSALDPMQLRKSYHLSVWLLH